MLTVGFILIFMLCLSVDQSISEHLKRVRVQPEQIHLSYGSNEWEIVVTWSTIDATPTPTVKYGVTKKDIVITGSSKLFVDGGKKRRQQYIHRVTLKNLQPNTSYKYYCGSNVGWSSEFRFKTVPSEMFSPKLAIFGDMGAVNAVSLPELQLRTQDNAYDAVIHVGDFAYDFHDKNGKIGDIFMRNIQPVAAYIPYMVCPGNHEHQYNFSHFRERFTMPGDTENLFYSYNLGPVHFISINTEAYWYLEYGIKLIVKQYEWLVKDLEEANQNRTARPWIILYGHRPMYCSGVSLECLTDSPTRSGKWGSKFGLEKLLFDYGVDVAFWGHHHNYERFWPIYNYTVRNGSETAPYTDPKAPIHIITGSGGSDELIEPFEPHPLPSSALRNINYGITEVQFHNSTHMSLKQVATDANNTIVDEIMVIKRTHAPYVV